MKKFASIAAAILIAVTALPLSVYSAAPKIVSVEIEDLSVMEYTHGYSDENGNTISNLRIFDCCKNLIRTLPALQRDMHKPNDTANEPHELTHAPDAIRYFIAGRPAPFRPETPPPQYNFKSEKPKPKFHGYGDKIKPL